MERQSFCGFMLPPHPDKRNIELSWDDKLGDVKEYHIYKAQKDAPLSLWQIIKGKEKGIYDIEVSPKTEYQYAVMAVLVSGAFSEMKTVRVKY